MPRVDKTRVHNNVPGLFYSSIETDSLGTRLALTLYCCSGKNNHCGNTAKAKISNFYAANT